MTPREALAEYGTLYTPGRKNGNDGAVHTDRDCHCLPEDCRDVSTPAALPLRPQLCRYCDPDDTVDTSADRPGVNALEAAGVISDDAA